jgi:excisionase family DNA binding protein
MTSTVAKRGGPEELWTLKETAAYLKVSRSTLYGWRYYGKGPVGYKIGGAVRFDPEVVKAWVASQ